MQFLTVKQYTRFVMSDIWSVVLALVDPIETAWPPNQKLIRGARTAVKG
jgi:hypothetical protein